MVAGRTARLLVIAVIYNALLAAWLVFHPGSVALTKGVDNVGQSVGEFLFVPLCFAGWTKLSVRLSRKRGIEFPELRKWIPVILGFGVASMAVGQAIWTYYEEILHQAAPIPSWADAGFLGVYPFLLVGIVLLFGKSLTAVSRSRVVLDSLMIMTALFTFSWYFVLGPTLMQATASLFARVVATAYPAADLVLATCLLIFATRWHDATLRKTVAILTAGLAVIIFTDSMFDYETLQGTYATGSFIDIGWPFGYMLICAGVDMVRRRSTTDTEEAPIEASMTGIVWRSLLPYVLVPLVVALAIFVLITGRRFELEKGVLIGGAVLIALVLVRQILVILENTRLYDDVQHANQKLEALSVTDPLTDLPNHRALVSILDHELERASRYLQPCSVIVMDLDHFKALNDGLGHAGGDAALCEFASVIRRRLRRRDTVARWGGEEFVVILPDTDSEGALIVAEEVRSMLAGQPFSVGGGIHLTCSLGVASFPRDGESRDSLLKLADRAMYAAKRLGRNQVRAASDLGIDAIHDEEYQLDSREDAALVGTVEALAALVDARDSYTGRHAEEVAILATRLASALGLNSSEIHLVRVIGRLHDVGKVAVPDAVLRKPGKLTTDEWAIMREHPVIGADVLSRVPALRVLAPAIRAHHEWWNGQGYPNGLAGLQIPRIARIVSVADAYTAMTSDRPYGKTSSPSEAVSEICRCAGTQFDADVVAALERLRGLDGAVEDLAEAV